jgi:hypothetical protein
MNRSLIGRALFGSLILASLVMLPASPQAAPSRSLQPEYTWTLAALGQGGWIGGPLFEDGSVGGGGALSTNNGKTLARFVPTTWTEEDEVITVCFDVIPRKGGGSPSTLCISGEANGTPVHMTIFGTEHIFRITEIGH